MGALPLETIRGALVEVRERQRLSDLARRLGIHVATPGLWASGARPVPASRLDAVLAVLDEWGIALPPAQAPKPVRPARPSRRYVCAEPGCTVGVYRRGARCRALHAPYRCTDGACGRCNGCRTRSLHAAGLYRRLPIPERNDRWTEREEDFLREHAGQVPVRRIAELLEARFGLPRTEGAVYRRAAKLGIYTSRHRGTSDLARLFDVSLASVQRWARRGMLPVRRWEGGRLARNTPFVVDDAGLRGFILEHGYVYDWRRMRPGPWRSLAEVEARRDPWVDSTRAAALIGCSGQVVRRLFREGRLDVPHRVYPKGGLGQRVFVRTSDLALLTSGVEAWHRSVYERRVFNLSAWDSLERRAA